MKYLDLREVQLKNAKLHCVSAYIKYKNAEMLKQKLECGEIKEYNIKRIRAIKNGAKNAQQEFYEKCHDFALVQAISNSKVIKMFGTQDDYDELVQENKKFEHMGITENMFDLEYWGVQIQK